MGQKNSSNKRNSLQEQSQMQNASGPIQVQSLNQISSQKESRPTKSMQRFSSSNGFDSNGFSENESAKFNDDEPLDEVQKTTTIANADAKQAEVKSEDAIKLALKIKKKMIKSSSFVDQTFPILASLIAESIKSNTRAPLDLICVLDVSGSMQGEKIELLKNTFTYLLEYLSDNDRLSIVTFNSWARRVTPLMRTTSFNKPKILEDIKCLEASGGTSINSGITVACEIFKMRRQVNAVSSIFLLSDGQDSSANTLVSETLKKYNLGAEVTINSFGFGHDHDPLLMTNMANLRDGNFYFIDQLDNIDEAFVDCLGGALSSLAQNVKITIKPEQSDVLNGVEIIKAYGDANMWHINKEDNTYTTKLAAVVSGRQKDFVLELKIPTNSRELNDSEKNIKVASAEVEMTGLNGDKIVKKAELYITLLNEGEEVQEEEDDRDVMKNFYRIKGALLISEAKALADQKKYDEGKKMLKGFKEEIENCFLKNEEFIINLTKDIDNAIISLEPEVYEYQGKFDMMENARNQIQQRSNFKSANSYQNSMQKEMVMELKKKKGGF